jgi:hypothetical protein
LKSSGVNISEGWRFSMRKEPPAMLVAGAGAAEVDMARS